MTDERVHLSLAEVARLLRMPPAVIKRWAEAGRIPATEIGGELHFLRSDIEAISIGIADERNGPGL